MANLNAAIATTKERIAFHEQALRDLDGRLHNQLAEFHRQSMKVK